MLVKVAESSQAVALGAAIFAAVASGYYKSIHDAQKHMASSFLTSYYPDDKNSKVYEKETGKLIIETFTTKKLDYNHIKACLVASHVPFTWGSNADEAVYISIILEEVARQNFYTQLLNPSIKSIKKTLLSKHYQRKHGKNAYYGQK